jgi:histidinol-phosphate aminotransferase
MTCDLLQLAVPGVAGLHPYQPGKPIEELERELGITGIIKLASNENALGPSPAVARSLSGMSDLHRYPDGNGYTLKHALSEFHAVSPEQITLGNGSNDILEFAARTFLNERSSCVYSEHAFAIYPIVTQAVGARGVQTAAKNYGHDLEAMLAAIEADTRLVFIANPNNPTGTCIASAELRRFLDGVPGHVIVVMDQAYYEYAQADDYPDCIRWLDRYPNLIVTRTFSKAHGLAALRVGYGISSTAMADLLNRVRQPFNVNSMAQRAAVVALQDQAHVERSVRFNQAGMHQLIAGLDSMGMHFIPSHANFICIDMEQEAGILYGQLLREGVIVRPVASYGLPNHLRVTIGLEQENARFLAALAKILAR